MPSIADNIESMAALVSMTKKRHHLTETTVMRIVDMNFAIAQSNAAPSFGGDEQFLTDDDTPEIPEGQLVMFPETTPEEEK